MKKWFAYNWLKLLAVAMTVGAVYPGILYSFPYAYYQLMDWVVVGAMLISAKQADQHNKLFVMWLCIGIAIIFNPIAPIYLHKDLWPIADLAAAAFLGMLLFLLKATKKSA